MNATTIEHVNSKLKQLPESLLEEVERYIDFVGFRNCISNLSFLYL